MGIIETEYDEYFNNLDKQSFDNMWHRKRLHWLLALFDSTLLKL